MVRMLALLAVSLAISGCGGAPSDQTLKLRGEARATMFVQCMELAAKIPRQADDDVADIVNSCSTQAAYITWYLKAP